MTRATLLVGTALQAGSLLLFALPGAAQPAPNARPTGGVITAGSAAISRTSNNTLISQTSQRAAVNWQGFNVGSQQSVTFQQPSSTAATLNRVTGPDPSQIAGRIQANGQVVLVNQAGVIFYKGAQVNSAGLVVSTAGVSDKNFVAGRLAFTQAGNPNAAIVNQGTITVQQAGLAALVAPQVANSGVITAKLGHVVLAGARTSTVDLYGDGLLAIDVGGAVTQAPRGPDGKPVAALVTNTGTITAQDGSVQLTARAVDGIVQNLVTSGGKVAANGAGTVVFGAVGGSVVITGQVAAAGGQVQADASSAVTLAKTARVSTSGKTGGGTVAIGTTLARAIGGPGTPSLQTAHSVTIAKGARIAANATRNGNGGRAIVLSAGSTTVNGAVSVRGGKNGGNGGFVEISGNTLALTTAPKVGAAHGNPGTILLDPNFLDIVSLPGNAGSEGQHFIANGGTIFAGDGDTLTPDTIANTLINAFQGNVLLQANDTITVSAPISLTSTPNQQLVLEAGGTVTVSDAVIASGNVIVATGGAGPAGSNPPAAQPNPLISVLGTVTSTAGSVTLLSGPAGTVEIEGKGRLAVAATQTVSIQTDALINTGTIVGGLLEVAPATVGATAVLGTATGLLPSLTRIGPATLRIGAVTLPGDTTPTTTAGAITIGGDFGLATTSLELDTTGVVTESAGVALTAATLTGTTGTFSLPNAGNAIPAIGNLAATTGNLVLVDTLTLTIAGTASAPLSTTAPGQLFLATSAAGGITVAAGGTANASLVSLQANAFSVAAGGTVTGSRIELAPDSVGATMLIGNAPGTSALASLVGFQGLVELGEVTQPAGVVQPGTAAAITAIGTFDANNLLLEFETPGTVTAAAAPLINVAQLQGAAGDFALTNAGNSIGTIDNLIATAGDLVLVDSVPLTVAQTAIATGQLYFSTSAAAGITIAAGGAAGGSQAAGFATLTSLQADAFSIAGIIIGGEIELAPNTAGTTMNIGAAPGTMLASLAGFVQGNVRLGAVTLPGDAAPTVTAGAITTIGTFDATGHALELDATGAITATGAPLINVTTLSGGGSNFALTNVSNVISGIGNLKAGTGALDVADTVPITVTGTASAATQLYFVTTAGGGITVAAGGQAGGISLTSLQANTFTLAGTLTGSQIELAPATTGSTMVIGAAAGSALTSLSGIGPDNVRLGAVTLPGNATPTTTAGAIDINGNFGNATTVLELDATGPVTQGAASVLTAANLSGTVGSLSLPDAANAISSVTSLTATAGDLSLVDGTNLTVFNASAADNLLFEVALTGGTLSLGQISIPAAISAGRVSLVADAIAAAPGLSVSTPGTAELAPFSAISENVLGAGGLSIDATLLAGIGSGALVVGGFTNIGGASPTASASAVLIDAAFAPTAGTLRLLANGPITQPGGAITVGTLLGSGTDIDLPNPANSVTTIGNLAASNGNLVLVDTVSPTVSGTASATGQLYLATPAADGILVAASGAVGGGPLTSLQTNAFSVLAGGTVTGAEIEVAPNALGSAMNIGSFAGTALLSLTQFGPGNVRLGAVTEPGAAAPTVRAETISALGTFDAAGHAVELDATGVVRATVAPLVNLTTLSGTAGALILSDLANDVGAIGDLTATAGEIDLNDTVLLTVTGTASAARQLYLETTSNSGITVAAGGTAGGTLTSLQANVFSLAGSLTGNQIELAPDTTGSTMVLGAATGSALTSLSGIGPVNVRLGAVTLPGNATPTTTAGAISINGNFGNAAVLLELDATGAVTEAAGAVLTATTLTGTTGGLSLPSAGNAIANAGTLIAGAGDLVLVDGANLTLTGKQTGANVFVEVALAGGTLALGLPGTATSVTATTGRLSLVADSMAAQPGDLISATGTAEIAPFSNIAVNVLGAGGLALDATLVNAITAGELMLGGFTNVPAAATTPAASSSAIIIDGVFDLSNIAGTLALLSTGPVAEPGGPLTVSTLLGSATDISLPTPANRIANIGNLAAASGNLVLVDIAEPTVVGAASATRQLYLGTPADQGIVVAAAGSVSGGPLTSLQANFLSVLAGGTINGAEIELAPDSAGFNMRIGLTPNPALRSLAGFGPGNVRLGAVTLPGGAAPTVTAATVTATGLFDATGHNLELDATGAIAATAAPLINVATLSGAGASFDLSDGANSIAAIGALSASAGAVVVTDTIPLTVTGTASATDQLYLETTAPGGITIAAAGTAGGTLTSLQADTFSLAGTLVGNQIELAPDTTGSTMIVGAAAGSALSSLSGIGPVNVRLGAVTRPSNATPTTTAGAIGINGNFGNASVVLELDATGAVTETAGAVLTAATLSGTAGSIALPNAGNAIANAGTLLAGAGDLVLVDGANLTLTGEQFGINVFIQVARAGGTLALGLPGAGTLVGSELGRVTLVADSMTAQAGDVISTAGSVEIAPFSNIFVSVLGAGGLGLDATLVNAITAGELLLGGFTNVTTADTTTAASSSAIAIDGALDLANITGTLALLSTGPVSEPGGPLTVGTLLGSATAIGLGNAANAINAVGTLSATTGNLALADLAPLTVTGAVSAIGQAYLADISGIAVAAGGVVGGALTSLQTNALAVATGGTITGAQMEVAPDTVGAAMNIGAAPVTALISLAGFGPGNVRLGAVTLPSAAAPIVTAGAIDALGTFDAAGHALELDATGAINATGAPLINVPLLSGAGGVWTLTDAVNTIAGLGNVTATSFTLTDAVALAVTGALASGSAATITDADLLTVAGTGTVAATAIDLTAANLDIVFPSVLNAGATGTVNLVATTGTIFQDGTLIAGTLTGSAAGFAGFSFEGAVARLGNFTSVGLTFEEDGDLDVVGVVNAGPTILMSSLNGALTISGLMIALSQTITANTGMSIPGTLNAGATGILDLGMDGPGAISATGALIAGTLVVGASGPITLTGAGNQIGTLAIADANGFTLIDSIPLTVPLTGEIDGHGLVSIQDTGGALTVSGGSVTGTAMTLSTVGNLFIAGSVSANSLAVSAGGAILANGPMSAGTLSGSATGPASFTGANTIAELGSFTAAGLTLNDTEALLVAGTVIGGFRTTITDSGGALTIAGSLTAAALALTAPAGIAISGLLSDGGAGTITLAATRGSISGTGTLVAGTLNATSSTINLAGPNNAIAALGIITASSIAIDDDTDLTIAGALTAPSISLRAPQNEVTLADGATIDTGGVAHTTGAPIPAEEPADGGPGTFIEALNFDQIGDSAVTGAGPSTLQIQISGSAQFNVAGSLHADNTWLILNLGAGTASGGVFVSALNVTYTVPGSASLTGTIGGISGPNAAIASFIQPTLNTAYQFNGCEIGAATCVLVPPPPPSPPPKPPTATAPPVFLPFGIYSYYLPESLPVPALQQLDLLALPLLPSPPRQLTDPDVVPPNISNLDY